MRFDEYAGTDPLGFVLARNLHRPPPKHEPSSLGRAKAAKTRGPGAESQRKIALQALTWRDMFAVSSRMVDHASALLRAVDHGRVAPELWDAVRTSEVTLSLRDQNDRSSAAATRFLNAANRPRVRTRREQIRGQGFDHVARDIHRLRSTRESVAGAEQQDIDPERRNASPSVP